MPDEIKSFHYRQDPPLMYPMVVFQKVNEDVRKDHITLLTNDKKNDTPFVELSNSHLLEHYGCKGVSITHDMEYNVRCASQFKCVRTVAVLACCNTRTTQIFCETSHSKPTGVSGVDTFCASCYVCGEKRVIQKAKELHQFFKEQFIVLGAFNNPKPILFYFILSEKIEEYHSSFPDEAFKYKPGALQTHQVVTNPED